MRVAVAALKHEANHFAPVVCTLDRFALGGIQRGPEVLERVGPNSELAGALALFRRSGVEPVPLMAARAVPYGPMTPECWRALKEELLDRLRQAVPVDGVYFSLHGATAAVDEDDPEGALLAAAREVVGPGVPIACSLDLHAHITPTMVGAATIIEGFRTYPHDDSFETGARAAELLLRTFRGEIRPVLTLAKLNMLVGATNQQTFAGPAALLWYEAKQLIRQGKALSVSLFLCHTKLDIPDIGFGALITTDGPAEGAGELAADLCRHAWALRREFDPDLVPPREAVRRALAADRGPVILADVGDAPGGGATGDSAVLLKAMLEEGVAEPCLIQVVDPEAAAECHRAGVGSTLSLWIGHKLDRSRGEPLAVTGRVRTLHDGSFTYAMGIMAGGRGNMGPCAVLELGSIQVLVTTHSTYEYGDEQYRAVGMDLDRSHITVVKAGINFKLAFQARARQIIAVDGPGPTCPDPRRLPYTRLQRPRWPLDEPAEPSIRTYRC